MKEIGWSKKSKNILCYTGLFLGIVIILMILSRILPYPISIIKGGIAELILILGGISILLKNNIKDKKLNVGKAIVGALLATILFYIGEFVVTTFLQYIFNMFNKSVVMIYIYNVISSLAIYFIWILIYLILCKLLLKLNNLWSNLKKSVIICLMILFVLALGCAIVYSSSQIMAMQMLTGDNGLSSLIDFMEMSPQWDLTNLIILVKCVLMTIISIEILNKYTSYNNEKIQ